MWNYWNSSAFQIILIVVLFCVIFWCLLNLNFSVQRKWTVFFSGVCAVPIWFCLFDAIEYNFHLPLTKTQKWSISTHITVTFMCVMVNLYFLYNVCVYRTVSICSEKTLKLRFQNDAKSLYSALCTARVRLLLQIFAYIRFQQKINLPSLYNGATRTFR